MRIGHPPNTYDDFWSRVQKKTQDKCWEWLGCRIPNGYGVFGYRNKRYYAHRFALISLGYRIPAKVCVCHRCDNKTCCNPDHLFLGSMSDNIRDRTLKGRSAHGSGHGNAKLSEARVAQIRRLYKRGDISQEALASMFGVGQARISMAVRGETWRHVSLNP